MSIVISGQPYADWLTESLGYLEDRGIHKLALLGIDVSTGETVTGYFNCTMADKAVMAANVQADALFESVLANADLIVKRAEEMYDEKIEEEGE